MAVVMPVAGHACSVEGHTLEALPDEMARSQQVFVARISDHALLPPLDGEQHHLAQVDYELVEAFKGDPALQGRLVERTPHPAVEGVAPGPACGPWVAIPQNEGETVLVFASHIEQFGHLVPNHRSMLLRPGNPDSERWLDAIRSIQGQAKTP